MNFQFYLIVAEIGFNPVLYSVDEISGVVVFVVENRNADLEREVTVKLTTIEGTATGNKNVFCMLCDHGWRPLDTA